MMVERLLVGTVPVRILEYRRSPKGYRTRLLTCPQLEACRLALHEAGFSSELPSGAKLFVHQEQVRFAMDAIAEAQLDLKPRHVIVSADYESAVEEALSILPSKLGVRSSAKWHLFG